MSTPKPAGPRWETTVGEPARREDHCSCFSQKTAGPGAGGGASKSERAARGCPVLDRPPPPPNHPDLRPAARLPQLGGEDLGLRVLVLTTRGGFLSGNMEDFACEAQPLLTNECPEQI